MEVRSIHLASPQAHPIPMEAKNNFVSESDGFFPGASRKNRIDIDDIMMDLEEVKHFLYMVIGGGVQVKEDDKAGHVINKLA